MESNLLLSFAPHKVVFGCAKKVEATIFEGRIYIKNQNPTEGYCLSVHKPFREKLYFNTYKSAKKHLEQMLEQ
jgi:hypothetical protein